MTNKTAPYLMAAAFATGLTGFGASQFDAASEGQVNTSLNVVHAALVQPGAAKIAGAFDTFEARGAEFTPQQEAIREQIEGKLLGFADNEDLKKEEIKSRVAGRMLVTSGQIDLRQLEAAGAVLLESDQKFRAASLSTIDDMRTSGVSEVDAKRMTLQILGAQLVDPEEKLALNQKIAADLPADFTPERIGAIGSKMSEHVAGLKAADAVMGGRQADDMHAFAAERVASRAVEEQATAPGFFSRQMTKWAMSSSRADKLGPNPTIEEEIAMNGDRADLSPGRVGSAITDMDRLVAAEIAKQPGAVEYSSLGVQALTGSTANKELNMLQELQFRRDFVPQAHEYRIPEDIMQATREGQRIEIKPDEMKDANTAEVGTHERQEVIIDQTRKEIVIDKTRIKMTWDEASKEIVSERDPRRELRDERPVIEEVVSAPAARPELNDERPIIEDTTSQSGPASVANNGGLSAEQKAAITGRATVIQTERNQAKLASIARRASNGNRDI